MNVPPNKATAHTRGALVFMIAVLVVLGMLASGRGAWAADGPGPRRGTVPTPTPKVTPTKPPTATPVPPPPPSGPPTPTRTVPPTRTLCADCPTPPPLVLTDRPLGLLVNAGGPFYTDSASQTWYGDQEYIPGVTTWGYVLGGSEAGEFVGTQPIAGTTDPFLYQDERWGIAGYRFELANGRYQVTLMWAEQFVSAPGQRVFSVKLQGDIVLKDFDILAAAGGRFKAVNRAFTATVTDRLLAIDFIQGAENPTIAAISVQPILPPTPTATASPTPGQPSPTAIAQTAASPSVAIAAMPIETPAPATVPGETETPTPTPTATPLPAEARAIAIFPQYEAALRSPNGEVFVRVPPGTTTDALQMVYIPEAPTTLPPVNAGFAFGSQAFALLALHADGQIVTQTVLQQPITLTVRYTDSDLAAARGDMPRLVLAQYHPEARQWLALQAQVDGAARTLTWRTRTLGQFALLIRQGAPVAATASSEKRDAPWGLLVGGLATVAAFVLGYRLRDLRSKMGRSLPVAPGAQGLPDRHAE